MKPIYFLSDAHLGSWAVAHRRTQERRLVRFLDEIKGKAAAVYLLGDMFDFWYEWRRVVPCGFVRFLGKLAELTDSGVEVHYFTGNHDLWAYDYLRRECGVVLHREPLTTELYGKEFFLAHGDGLGDPKRGFKVIRAIFTNRVCQWLFSNVLHPNAAMHFGLAWAKQSRQKSVNGEEPPFMGEENEYLVLFSKDYHALHPAIDFYIYGHRHIALDLTLSNDARMLVLGDWISHFTYAVWDGLSLTLHNYVEGESKV